MSNEHPAEEDTHESPFRVWYPRDILRRTNWLYRQDALRVHDIREMSILWELTWLCRGYATQFLLWAYALIDASRLLNGFLHSSMQKTYLFVIDMVSLLWSEGYCYF